MPALALKSDLVRDSVSVLQVLGLPPDTSPTGYRRRGCRTGSRGQTALGVRAQVAQRRESGDAAGVASVLMAPCDDNGTFLNALGQLLQQSHQLPPARCLSSAVASTRSSDTFDVV